MTYRELASLIAKAEGKKSQATVGDIREVIKLLRQVLGTEFARVVRGAVKPEGE